MRITKYGLGPLTSGSASNRVLTFNSLEITERMTREFGLDRLSQRPISGCSLQGMLEELECSICRYVGPERTRYGWPILVCLLEGIRDWTVSRI